MIIAKDTDNLLYLNKSLQEAEIYMEIDTGGDGIQEFSFCDDKGQIYASKEVKKRVFKLVPKGEADRKNLVFFIENAIGFGSFPKNFKTIDDLKRFLSIGEGSRD